MWEKGIGLLLMVGAVSDIRRRQVSFLYLALFVLTAGLKVIIDADLRWYEWMGGGSVGVVFLCCSKWTKEKIGYGDSWIIFALGACLGIWKILRLLNIAFWGSLLFVVFGLLCKKLQRDSRLPFLPFLFFGYVGAMWW